MRQGRLIYLMGASGAGKDSLIDAARLQLAARGIDVVRRVITRSAEASGEQALGVTRDAFEHMACQGRFALDWEANGLRYGIPIEIDQALAEGKWVLMNGSRGHLQNALRRYPMLLPVLVTVSDSVLRQRLVARGRETEAEIDGRLNRNNALGTADSIWQGTTTPLYQVDNSAALGEAVGAFIALIDRLQLNAVEG